MIKTRNIVTSINDVDSEWAFSHLLGTLELKGGDTKIRSPFSEDRTASFGIYKKRDKYYFNCFSTGLSGTFVDLFIELQKLKGNVLTSRQASAILKRHFKAYLETGEYSPTEVKRAVNGKGRVTDHEVRRFNKEDINYWKKYYITEQILDEYNVAPLSKFVIRKLKGGVEQEYVFENPLQFGYFNNRGQLFEIYQPLDRKSKCIRVAPQIKGLDQCTKQAKGWLCTEALKECMGFRALGIDDWHIVGADSANIPLPATYIEDVNNTYPKKYSMFDCDTAGIKAGIIYQEKFGIKPLGFDLGYKDLTDTLEKVDINIVKLKLMQLL